MLMPFQPYRDLGRAEEMASQRRARPVAVDAYRRGDELKVELDLPGADPGSIELTVENDLLSVKATRTAFWDKTDEVQVEERAYGQFGRQLFLGKSLDLGPHWRHLSRRRAHGHYPRGRAGQTPQDRGHPRRERGPGRRGRVDRHQSGGRSAGTELAHIGWPAWLKRAREGTTQSGHRSGPHRPSSVPVPRLDRPNAQAAPTRMPETRRSPRESGTGTMTGHTQKR